MRGRPEIGRYRFGVFEADASTCELRRQGLRIKLHVQPFQMLLMLLDRPGEVLTREEISRELWPDGTFVDYEHGVNSAVNRIREALGDSARNPRFIETLARRGYRFVAPVERIGAPSSAASNSAAGEAAMGSAVAPESYAASSEAVAVSPGSPAVAARSRFLASPEDLPPASYGTVQTLFVALQIMYLAFYIGALANLPEIGELFSFFARPGRAMGVLIVTAALLIPVRAFLLCAALFHAPGVRAKFLRIWPFLLPADLLWCLAPFLLVHHIDVGVAIACMALLVYSPFAQRSLILMGAGETRPESAG